MGLLENVISTQGSSAGFKGFEKMQRSRKDKIAESIVLCMQLEMPIPGKLVQWWNEEMGEKAIRRPEV